MAKRKAKKIRVAAKSFSLIPTDALVPYGNNAREHSKAQIEQLRNSLREFGFVTPILIDEKLNVIAGHGRLEAAKAEGMTTVPCVLVGDLTEEQRRAYILADNRLAESATWNEGLLQIELAALQVLDFDVSTAGFEIASTAEIEVAGYTRSVPGSKAKEETEADAEPEPEAKPERKTSQKAEVIAEEVPETETVTFCTCPNCGHQFEPGEA